MHESDDNDNDGVEDNAFMYLQRYFDDQEEEDCGGNNENNDGSDSNGDDGKGQEEGNKIRTNEKEEEYAHSIRTDGDKDYRRQQWNPIQIVI